MQVEDITIDVIRKNVKNLNLTVCPPDGKVSLSVPRKIREEEVSRFVQSKLSWIRKQQERIRHHRQVPVLEYVTGEKHLLAGKVFVLHVKEGPENEPQVKIQSSDRILMMIKPGSDRNVREQVMQTFYRKYLKEQIPLLIKKWEPVMGVKVQEWGVKRMKTRWGSCNPKAGRIWLNLELARKAPDCLEYLVVHEMAHLLERSHNYRFKALMDHFLPEWRDIKAKLTGGI